MSDTPESAAMAAATEAVRKILTQSKNPLTTLGHMSPTSVAYHAASAAISTYREAEAHERARREGGICRECGRLPSVPG